MTPNSVPANLRPLAVMLGLSILLNVYFVVHSRSVHAAWGEQVNSVQRAPVAAPVPCACKCGSAPPCPVAAVPPPCNCPPPKSCEVCPSCPSVDVVAKPVVDEKKETTVMIPTVPPSLLRESRTKKVAKKTENAGVSNLRSAQDQERYEAMSEQEQLEADRKSLSEEVPQQVQRPQKEQREEGTTAAPTEDSLVTSSPTNETPSATSSLKDHQEEVLRLKQQLEQLSNNLKKL